jgi:hypothetical protein
VDSESLFASWLDQHRMLYQPRYQVDPGNIDFLIESTTPNIFCDVKEIRESESESVEGIDAHAHMRSDIRKLRSKFAKQPELPVVLVTMNFSHNYFTGLTVARALLGDVGVELERASLRVTKPLHHLPKGNASLTKAQNRSIAGVLVFDGLKSRHVLYKNPFAVHPIGNDCFPETDVICLNREATAAEIVTLGDRMFWPINIDET